ncbi:hypothetical protein IV102_00685 [bacterium]|nr:hypothetical protein [bacterium]
MEKIDLPQRLREAYLAYRLNQSELAHLVGRLHKGESPEALEDTFTQFARRDVDWRLQSPDSLAEALGYLGLDQELAQLRPDQVWTGYQRALYRRLSQPEFDAPPTASAAAAAGHPLLAETLGAGLDEWDRDHDTHLTAREIDCAMVGETDPARAATLALVRRYQRALESCSPADGTGLTWADLHVFARQGISGLPTYTATINQTFQEYFELAGQMQPARPLAQEAVRPDAIHQGVGGTCVMLSTAVGTSAEQLRGMLRDNGDASFTIRFADGEEEIVSDLSQAERLYHSRGDGQDRWPGLLEMAMAQRLFREKRPQDGSLRSAIDGIEAHEAMLALTGKDANKVSLDELTLEQTRHLLARAAGQSGPVICATRPEALSDFISVEELHNGLVNGHCYAVVDFDAENDQVILQNPWHHGEWRFQADGKDEGRFAIPTTEFYCSYRWLATPQASS